MKNQMMKIASLSIAFSLFFVACNKNNDGVSPTEIAIEDNHAIVSETEETYQLSQDVIALPFGGRESADFQEDKPWKGTHGCADVTKTLANNVVTIVYDFTKVKDGLCNGKKVSGKMTITLPVSIKDFTGTITRTVTYENFSRGNDRTLNGSHTIITTLTGGKLVTSEKLGNMVITTADGRTLTFTSTKTRTKVGDDFQVTGNIIGKSSDGKDFSLNITSPLLIKKSCNTTTGEKFPVSGTMEIKPFDKDKRIVDYGNGTCDLEFTVTINGVTVTKTKKG
jgi:hypothetical protein